MNGQHGRPVYACAASAGGGVSSARRPPGQRPAGAAPPVRRAIAPTSSTFTCLTLYGPPWCRSSSDAASFACHASTLWQGGRGSPTITLSPNSTTRGTPEPSSLTPGPGQVRNIRNIRAERPKAVKSPQSPKGGRDSKGTSSSNVSLVSHRGTICAEKRYGNYAHTPRRGTWALLACAVRGVSVRQRRRTLTPVERTL